MSTLPIDVENHDQLFSDGKKSCYKCKEYLSLDNYYKNPKNKDGLVSTCKKCKKQQQKLQEQRKTPEIQKQNALKLYPLGIKHCLKCNEHLKLDCFNKCARYKSGLASHCKFCMAKAVQNSSNKNANRTKEEISKKLKQMRHEGTKMCNSCKQKSPFDKFPKSIHNADGLNKKCTKCCLKSGENLREKYKKRTPEELKTIQESKFGTSMQPKCPRCLKCKPLNEFYEALYFKYGISRLCIECVSGKRQEMTRWVREYKSNKSCEICGYSNGNALDFAHYDRETKYQTKSGNRLSPSQIANKTKFLEEIKLTRLLCKVCHRDETKNETNEIFKDSDHKQNKQHARHRGVCNAEKLKRAQCNLCKMQVTLEKCHCFDFDHLPEYTKIKSISEMVVKNTDKQIIIDEMKKCVLLCANCHKLETDRRVEDGTARHLQTKKRKPESSGNEDDNVSADPNGSEEPSNKRQKIASNNSDDDT